MLLRRYHKREIIEEEIEVIEEVEIEEVKVEEKIEETNIDGFEKLTVSELRDIAKERGIDKYYSLKKQELIDELNK